LKIIATIEARMGSTRLPGKILMEVAGKPILQHITERVKRSKLIDEVVVATTTNALDDAVENVCKETKTDFFRGSEPDITARLVDTAHAFHATHIMQLTGDCPFVDPSLIDKCINKYKSSDFDYVSNRLTPTYPCGQDVQFFSVNTLKSVLEKTDDPIDREHGSYFIYNHPELYKLGTFVSPVMNCPEKRWVLDYPEDFEFIKVIYENLYKQNPEFDTFDILRFLEQNPEVEKINSMHSVIVKNYL
jgi:spore coat polysaccharide biosynthesis protein SpsF